jgi:membrane-associated phospholipid phosphatase
VPAGVSTLVSAGSRLPLDRHYVTDLLGGALAGLAVSGTCLGAYELTRR